MKELGIEVLKSMKAITLVLVKTLCFWFKRLRF